MIEGTKKEYYEVDIDDVYDRFNELLGITERKFAYSVGQEVGTECLDWYPYYPDESDSNLKETLEDLNEAVATREETYDGDIDIDEDLMFHYLMLLEELPKMDILWRVSY